MKKIEAIAKNVGLILLVLILGCGPDIDGKRDKSFNGIIVEKIDTPPCFADIVIKHGNNIDTIKDLCTCVPIKKQLWKYSLLNDSISKENGELTIKIFRKNVVQSFEYPFVNNKLLRRLSRRLSLPHRVSACGPLIGQRHAK